MSRGAAVCAWRPPVPGVAEVLHASFTDHAYPLHTHDTWTVLILDRGTVAFDLDRAQHGAVTTTVTLLPPHVPHNGRAAGSGGFRKRVLYLEGDQLDRNLIGRAVDHPTLDDPRLWAELAGLHDVLVGFAASHPAASPTQDDIPPESLEAEIRLAIVRDRIERRLRRRPEMASTARNANLAERTRALLDASVTDGVHLEEASRALGAHPTHLVRAFSREFGLPPHRYLTGRRVDLARRLLLAGETLAATAQQVGFYDQSHLHRHFKRLLGVAPGAFATSATIRPQRR